MKLPIEINELTEEQAKSLLKTLVIKLDELDSEDCFGTEGWKHYFGFEN